MHGRGRHGRMRAVLFVVLIIVGIIFVARQLLLQRRINVRQAMHRRASATVNDHAYDRAMEDAGLNYPSDTAIIRGHGRGEDA